MKKSVVTLALAALVLAATPFAAKAQDADSANVPGHPRVNEVDQRLDNQQDRIDQGVAKGQLNANQATKDEARDAKVSQELSADEAKNGGHITKAEQRKMNRQLNHNSKKIHHQRKKAETTPAQ